MYEVTTRLMNKPKIRNSINIVNVVVSSKFDSTLDIHHLARTLPYSIYEPSNFPGLIYRRKAPDSTLIMFASGKITSTGNISEKMGIYSIHSTAFEISKIERKKITPKKISTVNVVACYSLDKKIDLKKFSDRFPGVQYSAKQFTGAILSLENCKSLVFPNGKIINVGCKSVKFAEQKILATVNLLRRSDCIC